MVEMKDVNRNMQMVG